MASAPRKLPVKAILLGSVSVGKTSLCHFLVTKTALDFSSPTIGCAHFAIDLPYDPQTDQFRFTLNVNDTSGSERYASLLPVYYRGSQIAVVVVDVKDDDSIYEVPTWLDRLDAANSEQIQCIPIFVINKCDLATDEIIARKEAMLRETIATHCTDPIIIKTCSLNGVGVYSSPNNVQTPQSSLNDPPTFTALIPAIKSILTVLAQSNSLTAQQKNVGIAGTKLSENHVDLDAPQTPQKGGCC